MIARTSAPHPLVSISFLLAFVSYFYSAQPIFGTPDIPWHIAAGEWMMAHGSIPLHDPWSFTAGNTRWFNISWLWDVLLSQIFSVGGPHLTYIFACLLGAINIATLTWCLKARRHLSDGYIALIVILVWYVQVSYLYAKPEMVSIFLTCVFHHLLYRHRTHFENRFYCIVLPLLMLLWVNMHGGFIIGFIIIGAHLIEAYETRNWAWFKTLIKLSATCAVACLINPYHIFIVEAVLRTLHSSITPYIEEWQPFVFGHQISISVLIILFILASNLRDANIALADKILAFAWLIAALQANRNNISFAILAAPYLAYSLQEFARHVQKERFKSGNGILMDSPINRARFLMLAITIALCLSFIPADVKKTDADPMKLTQALSKIQKAYPNHRFLNDYDLGGYIIFLAKDQWKLFVDGRAGTAYSEEVLQDTITFLSAKDDADAIIDKYRINGLILRKTHPYYITRLSKAPRGWKEIYNNDSIVAFVKKP